MVIKPTKIQSHKIISINKPFLITGLNKNSPNLPITSKSNKKWTRFENITELSAVSKKKVKKEKKHKQSEKFRNPASK